MTYVIERIAVDGPRTMVIRGQRELRRMLKLIAYELTVYTLH